MTTDSEQSQKNIQFYAASVAGWLNTSLEHDKSVFTLAAGGIGLLITLLTTVGISNVVLLVLYIAAILAFLTSLVAVLAVFRRNKAHIEQIFRGNSSLDPLLTALDHVAVLAFGIGAVLTAIIGISTAALSYTSKEKSMTEQNRVVPESQLLRKSFNGLGNLQSTASPTASASTSAPATGPAPASAPVAPASVQPSSTPSSGAAGK